MFGKTLVLAWLIAAQAQAADTLHQRLMVLDSHLDTPMQLARPGWDITQRYRYEDDLSQVDLPRMEEGGLDGGFWAVFTPQGPLTVRQIEMAGLTTASQSSAGKPARYKYADVMAHGGF